VTDATTNGLFRRLRRATSRTSPVPGPIAPTHPERWLRHASDEVLRVEDIVEPVWVIELELDS
jgi:hypothetical protein